MSERQAEIRIRVGLDENKVPITIEWEASDAPSGEPRKTDGIFLSLWDPENRNTLSIDLWTSELTVDQMNFFLLQTLLKMSETYQRATGNQEVGNMVTEVAERIADHLEAQSSQETDDEAPST